MTDKLSTAAAPPGRVIFTVPNSGRHEVRWARWNTRRSRSSAAIVSTRGEIDGSNAGALTEYLLAELVHCRAMILDISRLEFFGAAGFSMLQATAEGCAQAGMRWALVPNATVSRVLGICDPNGLLPVADTLDAALILVRHLTPMPTIGNRDRAWV